jgi:hypothetical protein
VALALSVPVPVLMALPELELVPVLVAQPAAAALLVALLVPTLAVTVSSVASSRVSGVTKQLLTKHSRFTVFF